MNDKFKFYEKWFWIGIVIGLVNFFAGWIYGIALYLEPQHRKEGTIIIAWSSLVLVFNLFVVLPMLKNYNLLP